MEEINYDIMRYILDNEGYVEEVAFGGDVVRDGKTCTEYTGNIPEGYENLLDWSVTANIRAYKIVDKNLAYDPNRDYKLKILYNQEAEDNRHITKKEMGITSTNEVNPYADLFPNLTSFGGYITWVEEEFGKVGNFPTEEVKLGLLEEQDIDLIELEFIGKNFLPNTATNTSNNGITYVPNIDRTIDVSGTATDKSTLNLAGTDTSVRHVLTFKEGTEYYNEDGNIEYSPYHYALFGLEEGINLEFYNYDGADRTLIGTYKNNDVITFDKDTNVTQVVLTVDKGTTIDTTIKPMLQLVNIDHPILPMTKHHSPSLMKFGLTEQTKNGITASYDEATQTFTFNGTCTKDNTGFQISTSSLVLPANTPLYWKVKYVSGSSTGYFAVRTYNSSYSRGVLASTTSGVSGDLKGSKSFETDTTFSIFNFRFESNSVADNLKIKVMLSYEDVEYQDYDGRDGQYYVDGVSTQNGTPTPDTPVEIVNIYKAGTYNAIINNRVYEFTIDEDLRSVPNVADRLWINSFGTVDIERKVGRVVLDGSEEWKTDTSTNLYGVSMSDIKTNSSTSVVGNIMSDKYIANNLSNSRKTAGLFCLYTDNLWFNKGDFSTVDDFKTWASTNNIEVQYELATQTTTSSGTTYNEYEYEEYKNNTTLIDLAGNELTTDDRVVIRDNQAMLVKNGALDSSYDQEGNEIPIDYEYKLLGYVSMPRTYTPYTNVYCHQRVYISFKYRDCRNIDMTKIDLKGSLTINDIETENLLINGVSIEENLTTTHETPTTTFLNGKRVYKKMYTGSMPSSTGAYDIPVDVEFGDAWIDESLSYLTSDTETLSTNFYQNSTDYLRTRVNKQNKYIRMIVGGNYSAYKYNLVLAYIESDGTEEPEEPEENPVVEVKKTSTITGSTNSSVWTFKTVAVENSINKTNKTSNITVTNYIGRKSSSGSSYFMGTYTTKYNCGGKTYSETLYKNSGTIAAGGWYKLGSHTFTITHTEEPMTINVGGSMSTSAFNPSSASASGTITLTEI